MANRHKARILAFQALYSWEMTSSSVDELLEFSWQKEKVADDTLLYTRLIVAGVIENIKEIDEKISSHLHKWDIDRLARVDLAILRLSVYSLVYQKDVPPGVTINEAIEISKEFALDDAYKFINGVLDGIAKSVL